MFFQRDAEDFTFTKLILREENNKLIDKCKELEKEKDDIEKTIGWIAQRRKRLDLRRKVNTLKKEFMDFDEVKEKFKINFPFKKKSQLFFKKLDFPF